MHHTTKYDKLAYDNAIVFSLPTLHQISHLSLDHIRPRSPPCCYCPAKSKKRSTASPDNHHVSLRSIRMIFFRVSSSSPSSPAATLKFDLRQQAQQRTRCRLGRSFKQCLAISLGFLSKNLMKVVSMDSAGFLTSRMDIQYTA